MKVLVIFSHPRGDSMTAQIKDNFEKGLKEAGNDVDTLDLYKIGWSPALPHEDEPDYTSRGNPHYTEEVQPEQGRLLQYDAVTFVYPAYWWSMPAMVKGYIDRVFNYEFAYGSSAVLKDKVKKIVWLLSMGSTPESMLGHKFGDYIDYHLNVGIAEYCGIESSKVVRLLNVKMLNEEQAKVLHDKAYKEGLNFDKP